MPIPKHNKTKKSNSMLWNIFNKANKVNVLNGQEQN